VAGIVDACVCRNFRHVVSGAPLRRRGDVQGFEDPADRARADRWPSFSSSPWILWYLQLLFSVASRSNSAAIPALTGGAPLGSGKSTCE